MPEKTTTHSRYVATITEALHTGLYDDPPDEAKIVAGKDALENLVEQVEAAERVVEAARRVCHEEGWNASPARMRALDRALDAYPAERPEA